MYHGIGYFEAHELIDSMDSGILRIPTTIARIKRISKIKLPHGYHPILEGTTSLAYRAREYLQGRNFDLNYLDRIGVGYCNEEHKDPRLNYFGYIIVPFKRNGVLTYFLGRDYIDNFVRYKNPFKEDCGIGKSEVLFNEEALFIKKKIYLTEGWTCAATIGSAGVSHQGEKPGIIQRNTIIKSPVEEVIIVPDADFYVNGLITARNLMQYKKIKVVNLDWFQEKGIGKDVNELGKETLLMQEEKTPWMDSKFLYHQMKVYANKRIVI
jgi:hypothetical protein